MPDMFADVITHSEKIVELEREIRMREQVYPRRVADRKMTQAKADRQIDFLKAILAMVLDSAE